MRAYIFDLDGVLVDSQPFHFDVDKRTLASVGVDAPMAAIHACAGLANADRFRKYRADFHIGTSAEALIAAHVAVIMARLDEAELRPTDGAADFLARLAEQGLPAAVASSSSVAFIEKMLAKIGLRRHFRAIVSGEDVARGKPAPDVFLKAAAVLGAPPGDCAVVEDSHNGVLAAKAAGMYCIGYQNPTSGEQDLSPADRVILHFGELL